MDARAENSLDQWHTAWVLSRANRQDEIVIRELASAPLTSLSVDKFARFLVDNGAPVNDDTISSLRNGLIGIYLNGARYRLQAKTAKARLNSRRKALALFTKGLKFLDDGRPPTQRGLTEYTFGFRGDDIKGVNEPSSLDDSCQQTRLKIAPYVVDLCKAIESEDLKPIATRKQRLRVLVECLGDWWVAKTGKTLAPYVDANRRDGAPAVVHGRHGDFLSLATALFGEIDRFKRLEITSAVTNVSKIIGPSEKRRTKTT